MIAVIDYGMGNVHSVHKALQSQGAEACITSDPAQIRAAQKIVLPGVGAFDDALAELEGRSLAELLRESIRIEKKPFLGICLGMQLLFERSEEAQTTGGLGIFSGSVVRFSASGGLKVPHMGWNQLWGPEGDALERCPLLRGVDEGAYVYFCHSFYPQPLERSVGASVTDYGGRFVSCVWQENVFGVQFHPEKSQGVGLKIIRNFVDM